jgi:hypothetical protein
MLDRDPQARLFPDEKARDDVIVINGRCVLRVDGDQRVVLAGGLPVAHFKAGDRMAEANAMVLLVEHGYAQQAEAARAFGCDVRSVRRFQRRYEEGGLAALLRVPGYPKGRPRGRGRDQPRRQIEGDRLLESRDRAAAGDRREGGTQATAAAGLEVTAATSAARVFGTGRCGPKPVRSVVASRR